MNKNPFICGDCGKQFVKQAYYKKHIELQSCLHRKTVRYKCTECQSTFKRQQTLKAHINQFHKYEKTHPCPRCPKVFLSLASLVQHLNTHSKKSDFELVKSAFEGVMRTYRLEFQEDLLTLQDAFLKCVKSIKVQLNILRQDIVSFKFAIIFLIKMTKFVEQEQNMNAEQDFIVIPFRSSKMTILAFDDITDHIHQAFAEIEVRVEEFNSNGSGYVIEDVMSCNLEISKIKPLAGSCFSHEFITYNKSAVPCIKDVKPVIYQNHCFFLAIAQYFLPSKKDLEDLDCFILDNLNISDIPTPVPVKSIQKFEEQNSHLNLSINVIFKDYQNTYYPIYASKNILAENVVNLLLFYTPINCEESEEVKDFEMHYALIRDFGLIFSNSLRANGCARRQYFCYNCFQGLSSAKALIRHSSFCRNNNSQIVKMPSEGQTIKYIANGRDCQAQFMMVIDFETYQKPAQKQCNCSEKKLKKGACKHKSKIQFDLQPFAYCLIIVDKFNKVFEHVVYSGEDAGIHAVKTMLKFGHKYGKIMSIVKPPILTEKDLTDYEFAEFCHICGYALLNAKTGIMDKCLDHDHYSQEYVGASHLKCNIRRHERKFLYCWSHNFSGFESHIILKALTELGINQDNYQPGNFFYEDFVEQNEEKESFFIDENGMRQYVKLSVMSQSSEKIKTLTMNNVIFLDSFSFLPSSLDKLVSDLKVSNWHFPILKQWQSDANLIQLLTRKGIFPYEHITSIEMMRETKQYPERSAFYSNLNGKGVSESDYLHGKNVWKAFQCENLLDYALIYCVSDVYLLFEAVSNFREIIWKDFKLDMPHYLSLPMMSKDLMLKSSGIEIELIYDQEICDIFRKNIRGGVSFTNFRNFNQEEMTKEYGKNVVALYLDANNLVRIIQFLLFSFFSLL